MLTVTLKEHLREVRRGRPGERFEDYYHRARRERAKGASKGRIVRFALAIVSFLIGVVLVFIPGPAILFFFLSAGLVASESLLTARALDWLEVRGRKAWRWTRRHWDRLPIVGKIAIVLAVVAAGAAAVWLGWKLLAG